MKLNPEVKKRLTSFKEEIERDITPTDVIAGVLAHLQPMVCYRHNKAIWHTLLYKYKDHELFKEFHWRSGGSYPYSHRFDRCMSILHISGCYSWVDFKYLMVRYKQATYLRTKLRKFTKEQRDLLETIAKDIHDTVERE